MTTVQMFTLDVLPPKCGVEAAFDIKEDDGSILVTFRAFQDVGLPDNVYGEEHIIATNWSELPIPLKWEEVKPSSSPSQ